MAQLKVYQENSSDVTVLPNIFIDEYMKEANDAQLKVYLYLLRTMSAHLETSVSDIADQFNHTEKDVLRALKYWEKNKLLTLEYDDSKALTGIRLLELSPKAQKAGSYPASVVTLPLTRVKAPASPVQAPAAQTDDLPEQSENASRAAFSKDNDNRFEKPTYTLDEIRAFKEKEETSQILFVVEQYIGKPLSPTEMRTILFFTDRLHFSEDLIDYLIQYCVEKGKKDFRYIEKVAISWAEEGITTPRQAAKAAQKYDKIVYDIMKALGKSSNPTKAEADYVIKWTKSLGFTQDIILEACQRTVMATDKHRFEYADRILNSWHQNRVRHKADIRQLDEAYTQSRSVSARQPVKNNAFNQMMHNTYDFDALEKELISN